MNRAVGFGIAAGWLLCLTGTLCAQVLVVDDAVVAFAVEAFAVEDAVQVIAVDAAVQVVFFNEVVEAEAEADDEAQPQNPNEQIFGPEVLDQWLFQNGSEQVVRKNLESQLTLRTADVDRVSHLTELQRKKLLLAGRSEVKRLFDQVDERRRKFQRDRRDQRRVNQLWQEIQPLRLALTGGHFGDASLFDKIVRKTLTSEQLPPYLQQVEARRQFRHRARLEMIILGLDKEVPLRAEQREKFLAVLQEIPPVNPGPYEPYALMYVAAQLPEERFRKILDDVQWKALAARFEQSRNMGQWLKQSGALSTDDPLEE